MKISTLSANLDDAVTELHHRNDYYELLQDNGKLRAVIEETSKTVQGAVQLRAESLRELAADNEALEARVLELEAEMDGMKAAIARTTELEAQVEAARVSETRLMAVIDGYKQDVEQERLKAMAAELENLKEVQVPMEHLQEAQDQVLMLREENRLLEEIHAEELLEVKNKELALLPKIQQLTAEYKAAVARIARTKAEAAALVDLVNALKTSQFPTIMQDCLRLISEGNKKDAIIKAERDERAKEREQIEVQREKEKEEYATKHAKLIRSSKEVDEMAAQYKKMLDSVASDGLVALQPSRTSISDSNESEAPSSAADRDSSSLMTSQTGDAEENSSVSITAQPPAARAASTRPGVPGKPPRSPVSPQQGRSSPAGGASPTASSETSSPAGATPAVTVGQGEGEFASAASAIAGRVPAKLVDAIMDECLNVSASVGAADEPLSSDDDDESVSFPYGRARLQSELRRGI